MNLNDMLTVVRRDLKDEDSLNYRWTNDELTRHIARAVKELSRNLPLESFVELATTSGSREINISTLVDRTMIEAVEYPLGQSPVRYQRFSLWHDTLTLLEAEVPDGSNCRIYYSKLHVLDNEGSTLPAQYEDLVAAGACGFAVMSWANYAINQVNTGGAGAPQELLAWGKNMLTYFRIELHRLGRNNTVRVSQLYNPSNPTVSKTTDYGP